MWWDRGYRRRDFSRARYGIRMMTGKGLSREDSEFTCEGERENAYLGEDLSLVKRRLGVSRLKVEEFLEYRNWGQQRDLFVLDGFFERGLDCETVQTINPLLLVNGT